MDDVRLYYCSLQLSVAGKLEVADCWTSGNESSGFG
jgi:hypothetical protein